MADIKVSIVFHSVCGNNYIIAREFYNEFKNKNIDVQLFRINDPNFESLAGQFDVAGQYKDAILKLDTASPKKLLDSDIIILGSPTYYGNVSGAVKSFMDSFSPYWVNASFWGKKLFSFATCANYEGGGDMCLNAINIFGMHLGMTVIPVPADLVPGQSQPAYGLLHCVGDFSNIRPGQKTFKAVKEMTDKLLNL